MPTTDELQKEVNKLTRQVKDIKKKLGMTKGSSSTPDIIASNEEFESLAGAVGVVVDYINDLTSEKTQEEILDEAVRRVEARQITFVPEPVGELEVIINPLIVNGHTLLQLIVWFLEPSDERFAGAVIWIKGYGTGNTLGDLDTTIGREDTLPFQVLTVVSSSPATILLEQTNEEVVIGVESLNAEGVGSGLDVMPTQTITLT